jgi:transcriptional regulator with XRE-family HTH domain
MDQASFGLRLRLERERRQISLAAIAQSTKIKKSLLAGLECGDVSQWPAGIFRRAFIREYAAAIGLPLEETVSEFVQLFPDGDGRPGSAAATSSEFRLTLVDSRPTWARPWLLRAIAAMTEVALFAVIGFAATLVLGVSPLLVGGVVASVYYTVATLVIGQSPLLWMMRGLGNGIRPSHDISLVTSPRDVLHIVSLPARMESAAASLNLDSELDSQPVRATR